jgi:prepilin peptidase CpaA
MESREILLLIVIGICGITDLRTGRIYNKVTYPATLAGLIFGLCRQGTGGVLASGAGFLFAAVLMGGLVLTGGTGGGDAKLLAAIGAIEGFPFIIDALFYSFLVGGAMALAIAIWQGRIWMTLGRVFSMLQSLLMFRTWPRTEWNDVKSYKIPFGVAICLGTVWAQFSPQTLLLR